MVNYSVKFYYHFKECKVTSPQYLHTQKTFVQKTYRIKNGYKLLQI